MDLGLSVLHPTLAGIFPTDGFMPHGHCYRWNSNLVLLHVASDFITGLAYVAISLTLYALVLRIKLPFSPMFLAFGAFILACGLGHWMEIYTLYVPDYWASGAVKAITAIASIATAIWLFPIWPQVVRLTEAAALAEQRRAQLEEQTRKLEAEVQERRRIQAQLLAANEELEAFSYSVSHDLRAPLRTIDGFSSLLLEEYESRIDDQGRSYLERVRRGTQRMTRLIEDLLKIAHVGRMNVTMAPIDLAAVGTQIVQDLRVGDAKRNCSFHTEGDLEVLTDEGLATIILQNLLGNAWKFTGKRESAEIVLGETFRDGERAFFVRDNGAGFSLEKAPRLFGPFERFHAADEFPGSGIGLATVKRALQRLGGQIWAESESGRGATFYFTLPPQPAVSHVGKDLRLTESAI